MNDILHTYREQYNKALTPTEEELEQFRIQAPLHGINENNKDVNSIDIFYRNPVFYSCIQGSYPVTKILLESGTLANWIDILGDTPLLIAIRSTKDPKECERIVIQLLLHGANPNLHCTGCLTPLMLAVLNQNEAVVDLLLLYGADPNTRFLTDSVLLIPNKSSALSLAAKFTSNTSIITRLLATKKLTPEVIFHASCNASPAMKQFLLQSI